MGFWKELKEEWTWRSIKRNLPDYLAIFIAVFMADPYRHTWKWSFIWVITFIICRFVILSIKKLISK